MVVAPSESRDRGGGTTDRSSSSTDYSRLQRQHSFRCDEDCASNVAQCSGPASSCSPDSDERQDIRLTEISALGAEASVGPTVWAAEVAVYTQAKQALVDVANRANAVQGVEHNETLWTDLSKIRQDITPVSLRSSRDLSQFFIACSDWDSATARNDRCRVRSVSL